MAAYGGGGSDPGGGGVRYGGGPGDVGFGPGVMPGGKFGADLAPLQVAAIRAEAANPGLLHGFQSTPIPYSQINPAPGPFDPPAGWQQPLGWLQALHAAVGLLGPPVQQGGVGFVGPPVRQPGVGYLRPPTPMPGGPFGGSFGGAPGGFHSAPEQPAPQFHSSPLHQLVGHLLSLYR